jgi:dGTPase
MERVRQRFTPLRQDDLRRAVVRQLIDWQVGDVLTSTQQRLAAQNIASVEDVRRAMPLVASSGEMAEQKKGLEGFLFERVYRHPDVLAKRSEAQDALRRLFAAGVTDPSWLPVSFRQRLSTVSTARVVTDYLAGMTDRMAWDEHRRFTAPRLSGTSSTIAD